MAGSICVRCKGKGLCGRAVCPILERFTHAKGIESRLSSTLYGSTPPSFFVGHVGYPKVLAGPMLPPEVHGDEASVYDDPDAWLQMGIEDVVGYRASMVRSRVRSHVREGRHERILDAARECALSSVPVDSEVWLEKPPKVELRFDSVLMPMGPSATLTRLEVVDNPKVPRKVEMLVGDTDATANRAAIELFDAGIPQEYITRMLSAGLLGRKRRLVPTRWAITATEDVLARELVRRVQYLPPVEEYAVYSAERFGNHFEVLEVPKPYMYELVEVWMKNTLWSPEGSIMWDGETTKRRGYSPLGGGYYAARISVLEHLAQMGRQAAVFVVREVYPSYWAPLGSWVIKKTMREALSGEPQRFETFDDAIACMAERLKTPRREWLRNDMRVMTMRTQRSVFDY
ncbi:MAG: Nre family DNA repair protein [Methermicoccaceae archaeon]